MLVLALLGAIRSFGDLWGPATLVLYAPRVVWLLPLTVLVPAALPRRNRWLLGLLAATGLVVLWPLMGLRLPLGSQFARPPADAVEVRVATFNIHDLSLVEPGGLIEFLELQRVDTVCWQEVGRESLEAHPDLGPYFAGGWSWDSTGTIATRLPIRGDRYAAGGGLETDPDLRATLRAWVTLEAAPGRLFDVANVHFSSIRLYYGKTMVLDPSKVRSMAATRLGEIRRVAALLDRGTRPTVVAGDFNMPVESRFMDPFRPRFGDAFAAAGLGYDYTRPSEWPWVGIDHVLADDAFHATGCVIGPHLGSDHRPVTASLALKR
jgi:hypothetical protein